MAKNQKNNKPVVKSFTGWKVKRETSNNIICSLIKNPIVYIESTPRHKIEFLMEEYPHQEWIAYLVGRISEKENFFVEDISVPPHKEVSTASAEAEPFHIPEDCVGIIHSHHSMGAFHSATDVSYVDRNFPISITVARKAQVLEFDAISYQVTLCGKGTTSKCTVKYVQPQPTFDKKEFLAGARTNIDKGKRKVTIYYPDNSSVVHSSYRGRQTRFPAANPFGYSDYEDTVTDSEGNVLTQEELDRIAREIWGEY